MRFSPTLLLLAAVPAFLFSVRAQTPAPTPTPAPPAPPGQNLVTGFLKGVSQASLWYGVDSAGKLIGNTQSLPVLAQGGSISDTPMPVSVAVADLNGDKLPDIAAMDPLGYLRIYFNSGTKDAPKFTIGELSTLFLTRMSATDPSLPLPDKAGNGVPGEVRDHVRRGPRICLTDRMGSGKNDLVIGNYMGEILFVPNSGSGLVPEFKQPLEIKQAIIPTMKDSRAKWGNVFAPAIWDWDKDGRSDLLVGEGSYSANSIHLLLNKGSSARPVFEENNRSVLAYGMGLEQLSPCVVDYNGDGFPDLLVTERAGKVAVYLNSGKPWKPGDTLAFDSFIRVGGPAATPPPEGNPDPMTAAKGSSLLSLYGICTIAAGDLNGDELFDLVFGKSNGRIVMALNTGTKTQPKFAAPADITSETKAVKDTLPTNWHFDSGVSRGNFYGFISSVSAEDDPEAKPPVGPRCIKAGYLPCQNKILPPPKQYPPAFPEWNRKNGQSGHWWPTFGAPANFYRIRFPESNMSKYPLKMKTPYVLSMRVKGNGVSEACATITCYGRKDPSESKMVRGDRGAVSISLIQEWKTEEFKLSPGSQWSEVKKDITMRFDNKALDDIAQIEPRWWWLNITFDLAPAAGTLYIDDIKLIEK